MHWWVDFSANVGELVCSGGWSSSVVDGTLQRWGWFLQVLGGSLQWLDLLVGRSLQYLWCMYAVVGGSLQLLEDLCSWWWFSAVIEVLF